MFVDGCVTVGKAGGCVFVGACPPQTADWFGLSVWRVLHA